MKMTASPILVRIIRAFPSLALVLALLATPSAARAAEVGHLQCDYAQNPLGIDDSRPCLSWIITSQERGDKQTAYQVLVSSSPEMLAANKGDLWDSGRVMSGQSIYIPYMGAPLASRMRCFWKVCVWDKEGHASAWSTPGSWTMGLLKTEDWTAHWITASRWFMPPEYRPKGLELGPKGGWADVDLGASFPIDAIKLYPLNPRDFPTRFTIEGSDNLEFDRPTILVDQSSRDYVLNGTGVQEFPIGRATVRFVRVAIPSLPGKKGFVVRQMEVMSGRPERRPDEVYPGIWNGLVARARGLSSRWHAFPKRRGNMSTRCLSHHRRTFAAQGFFNQQSNRAGDPLLRGSRHGRRYPQREESWR